MVTVFLPGESYGQRSLVSFNPWGRKALDTTVRLTHTHCHLGVLAQKYHPAHLFTVHWLEVVT